MPNSGREWVPSRPFREYVASWFRAKVDESRQGLYCQIHITRRCENSCAHCYFRELPSVKEPDMSLANVVRLLDSVGQTASRLGRIPCVDLTGGDPLLHPDFLEIAAEARRLGISIGIKGNPEMLNRRSVEELLAVGVRDVRLSLEGMEPTNDAIRGQGSFQRTLQAIALLKECGATVRIHVTVSKQNSGQLVPVLGFLVSNGFLVDDFTWSRYWSESDTGQLLSPQEFRQVSLHWLEYCDLLFQHRDFYVSTDQRIVPRVFVGFKEHLLLPLLVELGAFDDQLAESVKTAPIGCTAARYVYVIDTDGATYKCRKIVDSSIGNILESDFSSLVSMDTPGQSFSMQRESACAECDYCASCSGCRAIALAKGVGWRTRDPDCPIKGCSPGVEDAI